MHTDDSQMTIAKLSALSPAEQAVLDQALTGVLVMGAIAIAIGWTSFRAMGQFPAEARRD